MRTLRIGSGAGFAADRIEPAAEPAEHGHLGCLVFECLAERTIALAQLDKLQDLQRPTASAVNRVRSMFQCLSVPCPKIGRGDIG
ncbi:acyclic terpene utilization AtuA family protein [Amycolatopsis sp. NPDC051372]|uniref:acyclic terpene utilization AtuA family protein n=1 Tax=unclassified Amycolatopsis TaxID=2618356 RepID=UPI003427E50B